MKQEEKEDYEEGEEEIEDFEDEPEVYKKPKKPQIVKTYAKESDYDKSKEEEKKPIGKKYDLVKVPTGEALAIQSPTGELLTIELALVEILNILKEMRDTSG